jgi:CRISPR-associated endonuclease/helicase Cas3
LAHSGGHLLADHLQAVATLAGNFAKILDDSNTSQHWAYLAGLWHDLGKYRPGFQRFMDLADNPDAHIEGKVGGREKTHSAAGALWAMQQLPKPYGHVLAYLIAGHHAGLDDWDGGLKERLQSEDSLLELKEALDANPPANILSLGSFVPDGKAIPGGGAGFALWVRMLFSCLVDADFLDTEAHFDAGKPARREGFPTLEQMRSAFDAHMAAMPVVDTPVSALRAIIEQTADVFRNVFKSLGDEVRHKMVEEIIFKGTDLVSL